MLVPATARRLMKTAALVVALLPLALLVHRGLGEKLGANPIETVTRETGIWALRFLLITLAVSPLRRLSGWHAIITLRRMFGLFAFFYATLHFGIYLVFEQFFDLGSILEDVAKRPYITVGFLAFTLLVPLAVTSTKGMIRRLGGRKWRRLHLLIHVSTASAVVHYLWLVKADTRPPLIYGILLAILLGFRVGNRLAARSSAMASRLGREIPIRDRGAKVET